MKKLFAVVAIAALLASASASETIIYRYDAKGRLTKVERSGTVNNNVTTEYLHDKADNRTDVVTTGAQGGAVGDAEVLMIVNSLLLQ